jgi:hypothetical protein
MSEAGPNYSVSFRLQRTTTEFAFVSVPVTHDLMLERPDGTGSLDVERMVERAVEMASASEVMWQHESCHIQPHPIQTPPPESKRQSQGDDSRKLPSSSELKEA